MLIANSLNHTTYSLQLIKYLHTDDTDLGNLYGFMLLLNILNFKFFTN